SLFGIGPRRRDIAAALGFNKKAAQAEKLGVGAARHFGEGALRRLAIAGELRRLRAEQERQRFARRQASRVLGVFARGMRITTADGDQAAGYRLIAFGAATVAQEEREEIRRTYNGAQYRPKKDQQRRERREGEDGDHDRRLDLQPKPRDRDLTGTVGKPAD